MIKRPRVLGLFATLTVSLAAPASAQDRGEITLPDAVIAELVDSLRGFADDPTSIAVEGTWRDFSDAERGNDPIGERWSGALGAFPVVTGAPYACAASGRPGSCRIAGDHTLIYGFTRPQWSGDNAVLRVHLTIFHDGSRGPLATAWVESTFERKAGRWALVKIRTLGRS